MTERIRFLISRLRERLWWKPLVMSVFSAAVVLVAGLLDKGEMPWLPVISKESVESLLSVMAASMLVIATLAVASMVAAYASASAAATPRSFSLVIGDGDAQKALSTFVGAFIFSIAGLVASKNGHFDESGWFVPFTLTIGVFSLVIITFVRWVDDIARLGRIANTIEKAENATRTTLRRRKESPLLGGAPMTAAIRERTPVFGEVGYVQRIDMAGLQGLARSQGLRVQVAALPGAFSAPGRPLAFAGRDEETATEEIDETLRGKLAACFVIGSQRTFYDDPRFGLVVLSEIASRSLSPAVNDPGTAISVIGRLVSLLVDWSQPGPDDAAPKVLHDHVEVPAIDLNGVFDDAFTAISRDGAGILEVAVRLQKALASLAAHAETLGDTTLQSIIRRHSAMALARAEAALTITDDLDAVRAEANRVGRRIPDDF